MTSSNSDQFFGAIFLSDQPKYASCDFVRLARVLHGHVTPEVFTRHSRRMVSEYGFFRLSGGSSSANLAPLLDLIDPSQVDLVKIYAIESNYKSFGIELVFIEGVVDIRSYWTFDGNHESELKNAFWDALEKSPLLAKAVLQDGDNLEELTYSNLRSAKPSKIMRES